MINRKLYQMSHEKVAEQLLILIRKQPAQDIFSKIKDLLFKARDCYYNKSISIMPDHIFDSLESELKKHIPQDDYFKKIGAKIEVTEWKKVAHKISMKSLNKVNTVNEFNKWIDSCGVDEVVVEDKLDGGSLDLEYKSGKLIHAITRGDGIVGEDIYENVRRMKGVKTYIQGFSGSLRGEIFLLADDFEKINSILEDQNEKLFANPRNGAVGIAKRFDGRFSEFLTVYHYDIESEELYFKTEFEKMEYLKSLGLKVCFFKKLNKKQAIELFLEYEKHLRAETQYDIDGLVIKINDNKTLESLGLLGENYKGQVAWKFEALKVETIIENIEWSNGRNRRITPIANIKETPLGGVKIRNISLHNLNIFQNLKIGKGDKVLISRRNDVIPYLEKVTESKHQYFKVPERCPVCNHPVEIEGKYLICPNDSCSALAIGNFEKWVEALEIMDISEKTIAVLYKVGKIKDPSDFYKLTTKDISSLERYGEKSATTILTNFNAKKELELPVFIAGLNIHNFASRTAETLVQFGIDTIEKMQNITVDDLIKIKGIQTKTAECIVKGLKNKNQVIKNLLSVGITFKAIKKIQAKGNSLANLSFCFTGAINKIDKDGNRYTREMMHELVLENGGKVEESVKKGLSYLVMADPNSNSGKAQKARQLNIDIMSENEFFKRINC